MAISAATAQRITRDRGDDGLAHVAHLLPADGDEVLKENVLIGLVLHLLDVGTGGESLLAAGQDHAADAGIGLECIQRQAEFAHQVGAKRVQRLWAVQADDADPALGLGLDVLVCSRHWMSSSRVDRT